MRDPFALLPAGVPAMLVLTTRDLAGRKSNLKKATQEAAVAEGRRERVRGERHVLPFRLGCRTRVRLMPTEAGK